MAAVVEQHLLLGRALAVAHLRWRLLDGGRDGRLHDPLEITALLARQDGRRRTLKAQMRARIAVDDEATDCVLGLSGVHARTLFAPLQVLLVTSEHVALISH